MESKNESRNRSTYERRKYTIVRFIKSQRMEHNKNVKAIMKWNPIDRRSRGRPKTRWKDDVEADLRTHF
jgi:hypothetical protein